MSMQLVSEIQQLKVRLDAAMAQIEGQKAQTAALLAKLEEYATERREHRKALRMLEEQFATFAALKEVIAKDAREILGAVRDRIDPTKVKMPQPLKALGYAAAR
jgi:cell division protein FtsB